MKHSARVLKELTIGIGVADDVVGDVIVEYLKSWPA